jgi:hypothetical protein
MKESNMKQKLFILALCFMFFYCGEDNAAQTSTNDMNQYLITDINKFYLDQLNNHQFLLLGESKHNDHVFNNAVIDLINYRLDSIEKGENVPLKITLVLEYSQSIGKQLNEFFKSDDVTHLGIEIQGRTLNTLEFFYDLKNVFQRADKMKDRFNLEFEIFCPEKDIPFDLSREEQKKIAETERDDNITRNILDYIGHKLDYKLIAFYGGGHIVKKERPDFPVTLWGLQINEKGINAYAIALNHFNDPLPFLLPFFKIESDFAITHQSLKQIYPKLRFAVDAHVFYREPYFQAITLKDIPSVMVVQKALEYAKKSPRFIPALISLWHRYTGEVISNSSDIFPYVERNINSVSTIEVIDNLSLFNNLFKEFAKRNAMRQEIDGLMFDITCFSNLLSRKPYPLSPDQTPEELWRGIIEKYQRGIKMNLYTAILFYGTPKEKALAQAKLKELTEKDFTLPKEWLQYSRQMWNSI